MASADKHNKLLQEITTMMTDPSQAQNDSKIESIMNKIRNLDPKKTSDQLRLASCHFMTMYHTRKAMTIGMPNQGPNAMQQQMLMGGMAGTNNTDPMKDKVNLEAVEKFKIAQRKDMELGWELLSIRGSNSTAAKTARVLKIEVAQRLEDSFKLKEAFDDLMKRDLTAEETMVAFTAAPFLGDWKTMCLLGKKIEKMPGGLEQLHMMSLQLPIPDFTLIYALCKYYKLNKKPTPNINTLHWKLYNVSKIRVKFKSVDCGQFEQKKKELVDEIKKQGDVEWEDVPNTSHVHIKQMGALCQAVSFGELPMMLNGPWLKNKIHVRGRSEMPLMSPEQQQAAMSGGNPFMNGMNPNDITVLVQEEEWELDQDTNNPLLYIGIYTLKQRPQLPPNQKITPEHAPVNMTFDCEIHIGNDNQNNSITVDDEKTNDLNNNSNKNSNDEEDDDAIVAEEEDNNVNTEPLITEFDGLELD